MKLISRNKAIKLGLKRYFTGKPCSHGHVSERVTQNHMCVVCKADWGRLRNIRDKVEIAAYNKAYRIENKERIAEQRRNSPIRLAGMKKWRDANKEHRAAYQDEYIKAGYSADNLARRRSKKLAATAVWANHKKIQRTYQLAAWASRFTDEPLEVDHVVPLQGELISGLHVEDNLQILSRSQNRSKGNRYCH